MMLKKAMKLTHQYTNPLPTLFDGKEGHEVDICTNNAEDHNEDYDRDRHEHVDTSARVREAVPMISFYF